MERLEVKSSMVKSAGWEEKVLQIEYRDGAVWNYSPVHKGEVEKLRRSSSFGRSLIDLMHQKRLMKSFRETKVEASPGKAVKEIVAMSPVWLLLTQVKKMAAAQPAQFVTYMAWQVAGPAKAQQSTRDRAIALLHEAAQPFKVPRWTDLDYAIELAKARKL